MDVPATTSAETYLRPSEVGNPYLSGDYHPVVLADINDPSQNLQRNASGTIKLPTTHSDPYLYETQYRPFTERAALYQRGYQPVIVQQPRMEGVDLEQGSRGNIR